MDAVAALIIIESEVLIMERIPENSDLRNILYQRAGRLYDYDPYTFNHSLRVAILSGRIAFSISENSAFVKRTCVAALMHDIGKIFVPVDILNKPGGLTGQERCLMELHPILGYSFLNRFSVFDDVKESILCHHERYDGLGYPFGLKREQIPVEARIISVADTFDALTSDRAYQCAVPFENAAMEINCHTGRMFDPAVVEHFNRIRKGCRGESALYHRNAA